MRDVRSNKKINIHKNNPASIGRFKQRSNATLILDLYDEFSNYVDLANQEISIRVERPDGITFEQIDNITKNSNVLTVKLKNEVLEVEGKCRVELNLKDSEGQMNTADFFFEVGESVLNDDIVLSSDSYESLEKALVVFRTESNSLMKKLDDNEKVRISNENTRKTQETSRINAENTRNSKENERISLENTRKSQEEDRKTNENTRKAQENTRQENENTRKSQETGRINKENERKTNEDARKASESDRQTRFSKLENDGKKLITEMNTAIDGTITREITEARGTKAKLGIRLNDMEQQSVENTSRIEQLEDLTPVWQEHEGAGSITVNDSFDGVTKDLVVKGKTYSNVFLNPQQWYVPETGKYASLKWDMSLLKTDTTYTILFFNVTSPKIHRKTGFIGDKTFTTFSNKDIDKPIVATTRSVFDENRTSSPHLYPVSNDAPLTLEDVQDIKVMFIEGDCSANPPREYFDSITSAGKLEDNKIIIKSVGKNLFSSELELGSLSVDGSLVTDNRSIRSKHFMLIKENTKYHISNSNNYQNNCYFYDSNFNFISSTANNAISTPANSKYLKVRTSVGLAQNDLSTLFQLEEGTKATNYEDYVEDIKGITIPFDGGLKRLPNGVADEINYSKIIQSVGKIVLNGGENWAVLSDKVTESTLLFRYAMPNTIKLNNGETGRELTCDRFNPDSGYDVYNGINNNEGISIANSGNLFIRILKSKLSTQDVAGFKAWLQQNPTTLYYELNEPIVHRLNQDINLVTFGTTTHIMQENNILSDISFKAKVSLSSQAKRLTEENRILKEENVILKESSIKTTEEQEIQDQKITTTMLANTELFEMMLNFIPMKLDDKQFRGGEMNMVEVYVTLIIQGDKTLEQVPTIIRPKVEAKLRLLGVIA